MNESFDELESALSQLRPRGLSADVEQRIAAELDAPGRMNWGDRCLLSFMGAGALAASVIVGLLCWQVMEGRPPAHTMPATLVAERAPASIGDYQQALARSSASPLELLR